MNMNFTFVFKWYFNVTNPMLLEIYSLLFSVERVVIYEFYTFFQGFCNFACSYMILL
jgi:hypothetical protein